MANQEERLLAHEVRKAEREGTFGISRRGRSHTTVIESKIKFSKAEEELLRSMALTVEDNPWQRIQFTNKFNSLAPTYDPTALSVMSYQNNTLRQCIAAMMANVDATGYEIVRKDGAKIKQVPAPDQPAPAKGALQKDDAEGKPPMTGKDQATTNKSKPQPGNKASDTGATGKPDLKLDDANGSDPEEQAMIDPPDVARIKAFWDEPYPGISFMTMRRVLREHLETTGNGYLEVIRDQQGKLALLNPMDAKLTRLLRHDDMPVPVEHKMNRTGQPGDEQTVVLLVHERRFVQIIGLNARFFKVYKATRNLNAQTGVWQLDAPTAPLPVQDNATEVIHFIVDRDVLTPYGIPRWINQIPSVMGSRKAEELNLEFFESGGVPPMVIMIQGGTLSATARSGLTDYLSGKAKHKQRGVLLEIAPSGGDLNSAAQVKATIEKLGDAVGNDSKFEKYDDKCTQRVRMGFRLPPLLIGLAQDYNYATAQTAIMFAEEQVFKPERRAFDEVINSTIMKELDPTGTYLFKSKDMTAKFLDEQLKALGMVKGTADNPSFLKAVNDVAGLDLKLDHNAQAVQDAMHQQNLDSVTSGQPMMFGPDANAPPGDGGGGDEAGTGAGGGGASDKGGGGGKSKGSFPGQVGRSALKKTSAEGATALDPDNAAPLRVAVTRTGKIRKLDPSMLTDLANDWAAMLTGEKNFLKTHVEAMHQLVKSMTPGLRNLFAENVAQRVMGATHDPAGVQELVSCAGDVLARIEKSVGGDSLMALPKDCAACLTEVSKGNPYHDAATGEFTTADGAGSASEQEYVYHGTPATNRASIEASGLTPNKYGNPLNFHHLESSSAYYAGQDGLLFRVKVKDLPKDTQRDSNTDRSWTSTPVPADKLEIHTPDGWKPFVAGAETPTLGLGSPAPKVGEKFVVYRLGSGAGELGNRNAGDEWGVAGHLARVQGDDGPVGSGGVGDTISAYEVTINKPFGPYKLFNARHGAATDRVGREAGLYGTTYSFPQDGAYSAKLLTSVPLSELHGELQKLGYSNFDDSGSKIGGEVIHKVFTARLKPSLDSVLSKSNPYHDAQGEFTSAAGAASGAGSQSFRQVQVASFFEARDVMHEITSEEQLTAKEKTAMEIYRSAAYLDVNEPLRQGKAPTYDIKPVIEGLDSLIAKSSLPENLKLFRGVSFFETVFGGKPEAELVGTTFTDKGFVSTSLKDETAVRFGVGMGGAGGATLIEIDAPKGLHAAAMVTDTVEGEVILPRGSQFVITSVSHETFTTRIGEKREIRRIVAVPVAVVKTEQLDAALGLTSGGTDRFTWGPGQITVTGGKKKLYVFRRVTNAEQLIAWAKGQGFATVLQRHDLHVTQCYSKTPLDWSRVPPDQSAINCTRKDGPRAVHQFGGGAVVLEFTSPDLNARWLTFQQAGATSNFASYRSHITFTYEPGTVDLAKVQPYEGVLEFGPEHYEEITGSFNPDGLVEKSNPYHDAATGEFTSADNAGSGGADPLANFDLGHPVKPAAVAHNAVPLEQIKTEMADLRMMGVGFGEFGTAAPAEAERLATQWQANMGTVSPREFILAMTGSEGQPHLLVRFNPSGKLTLAGQELKIYGAKVKEFERTFNFTTGDVHHDYMVLAPGSQGAGAVKQFFANAVPLYQKMGMRSISVFANLDAGGYAWTRFGFKAGGDRFLNTSALAMQADVIKLVSEKARRLIEENRSKLSPDALAEYVSWHLTKNGLAQRAELDGLNKLTDLQTPHLDKELQPVLRSEIPTLKQPRFVQVAMTDISWAGEIKFTDEAAMTRLKRYVGL